MALKMAFAGVGYIARVHANAAKKVEEVELVAAVNHRKETMDAFADDFGVLRRYIRIEDMLADGDVDAVIVSTPNYLHAPQTVAALEAGVHVMVEKPMAMNAAEAEEMVAASEHSGALLMVAHCWRFDREVLWLKEQVDAGRIGRIVRTTGYGVHVHWGPGGWFTQKQFAGGGALADMGIHAIDTARFLLGDPEPASVYARVGTYYGDYDVDDTDVMIIQWDNGAFSYIESGWWQPHSDGPEAATRLFGTQGYGSVFPTLLELPNREEKRMDMVNPGFQFPRQDHGEQRMYDEQMRYFVESVRTGRKPVPGGDEGLVNMRIVDAAYESARTNRLVEIGV
ncbi:MAG: Gfo/Idh/MocA family oxidoreductase [Nitrospiraceae bacterium]|nr:Gfo/Idh/MocA family oxidoreductase [Nitrospiraceae bacterium]